MLKVDALTALNRKQSAHGLEEDFPRLRGPLYPFSLTAPPIMNPAGEVDYASFCNAPPPFVPHPVPAPRFPRLFLRPHQLRDLFLANWRLETVAEGKACPGAIAVEYLPRAAHLRELAADHGVVIHGMRPSDVPSNGNQEGVEGDPPGYSGAGDYLPGYSALPRDAGTDGVKSMNVQVFGPGHCIERVRQRLAGWCAAKTQHVGLQLGTFVVGECNGQDLENAGNVTYPNSTVIIVVDAGKRSYRLAGNVKHSFRSQCACSLPRLSRVVSRAILSCNTKGCACLFAHNILNLSNPMYESIFSLACVERCGSCFAR